VSGLVILKQPESERRTKVKVLQDYRLAHAGEIFGPGDTAEIPAHVAEQWIASGWANPVSTRADKTTKEK
jgi:hypothetical protein